MTRRSGLVNGLAVAVAILLCITLGASPAAATHFTETGNPEGPTVPWGFNEFWGFPGDGTWSGEQADREIALANAIMPRALSAHRFFVQWRRVEGTRDRYNWAVTDRAYQAMQGTEPERKPVMVIHDAADWARDPDATCPAAAGCTYPPLPEYDDEWRQFVQDAVSRYPNVRAVEVWNEPNRAQFWGPAPDPGRYVEVLALAHDAVAAAGIDVPVIIGGLGPVQSTTATRISSREFLREIYNRGGADDFEGIGTHEYPTTEPLVDDMWHEINRLFAVRDNHDDPGTPLWNTEVSVSSDTTEGFGPERQGTELIRLHRSLEGHDIRSFIIYRFHDAADNTPMWNHTGVVDQSLVPKPAYCELGAAIGEQPDACPDTTPPTASFTHECTDLSCNFNGSASSDPDGAIASYEWSFGDGTTGSGATPSHAYAAAGTYTVTLTVTDDSGATASQSLSVSVTSGTANAAPTASFTHECTDLSCNFNGSASSDPDGAIASYEWSFGDGTTGSGATPSHAYAAAGTYTVTLTVTDDSGATASQSQSVSVTSGTTAPALTITSITPNAIAPGTTPVTIGGSGLVSGTKVSFENGKGPGPRATVTGASPDGTTLSANLDLKPDGPKGSYQWDVRATNPDSSTAVVVDGLTVTR